MFKKLLIVSVVIICFLSAAIVYVNKVVLPRKIYSLVVEGLAKATGKEVALKALSFNFFKGLVLSNLTISDGGEKLLEVREASATFLLPPLLKRSLVIPSVRIIRPQIFLTRRQGKALVIPAALPVSLPQAGHSEAAPAPVRQQKVKDFSVRVEHIELRGGSLIFRDETINPASVTKLDNLNCAVGIGPSSANFKFKGYFAKDSFFSGQGAYEIKEKNLKASVDFKNITLTQFASYASLQGVNLDSGVLSGSVDLSQQAGILKVEFKGAAAEVAVRAKGVGVYFDSIFNGSFARSPDKPAPEYFLRFVLSNGSLKGVKGAGDISVASAKVELSADSLSWQDANFNFSGIDCTSEGRLSNFTEPNIVLSVSSKDFNLKAKALVSSDTIKVDEFALNYFNSRVSCSGVINKAEVVQSAGLTGKAEMNLSDLQRLMIKNKDKLQELNPSGIVSVTFRFNGNPADLKECKISLGLTCPETTLRGLKLSNFALDYQQEEGIADLKLLSASLYSGSLAASGSMNLQSKALPYWINFGLSGVKLEELKQDTKARDKDISGILQADCKLNGQGQNRDALNGAGKIMITEGKLWELDLFKGMGALLFPKDFQNIVFNEATCAFNINDKSVYTDLLTLKSNYAYLSGPVRIGFDGSIDASLGVDILNEMLPVQGKLKTLTTAIISQTRGFGSIEITGTLKEPKYKFVPAVANIIKGIADTFLNNKQD